MGIFSPRPTDLADAWIDGDETARWRSATGLGPSEGTLASGSSVLEVEAGHRLPWHTDSAEETIAVVSGRARVTVGDETAEIEAGGLALVPAGVLHEVRNAGHETLRFVAFYAGTDVVTRYQEPVQPDGSRERRPLG
jgi:quercetin dioxygenase-like cupin family protein